MYCVKLLFAVFAVYELSWKTKKTTMVDFQQQSTQRLDDINEHMDSRNDEEMMRLKAMPVAWF